MTFVPAQPPKTKSKATGVSFCSRLRGSDTASIYLSAEFQTENFDESVIGWKFNVLIGRGENEGKLLLQPLPEGKDATAAAVTASRIMKGTARISVRAWDLLGRDTVKSEPCRAGDFDPVKGLMIELPAWCQPEARKARDIAKTADQHKLSKS